MRAPDEFLRVNEKGYGVSEGIRTPGRWSHNPELYQLSYAHHTKKSGEMITC